MVAPTAQTDKNYDSHIVNYSCVSRWGKYIAVWVYTNYDPENPPIDPEIKDVSETADQIVKAIIYKAPDKNHHLVGNYLQGGTQYTTALSSELQFTVECKKVKEGHLLLKVLGCVPTKSQMPNDIGSFMALNNT